MSERHSDLYIHNHIFNFYFLHADAMTLVFYQNEYTENAIPDKQQESAI